MLRLSGICISCELQVLAEKNILIFLLYNWYEAISLLLETLILSTIIMYMTVK